MMAPCFAFELKNVYTGDIMDPVRNSERRNSASFHGNLMGCINRIGYGVISTFAFYF